MKRDRSAALPSCSPLRIVLAYMILGALWIIFSDVLMGNLVPDQFLESASIAKGWIFIAVTALLLHLFIRRRLVVMAQTTAEARENEALFRSLFEQAAVGVAQVDIATGLFVRINRRYCDIVGYSPYEMESLDIRTITHPDDLAEDKENMRRLAAGEIREFSVEKRYLRKDGEVVWVILTVSLLYDSAGRPAWYIAVVENITERKRAEDALRKSETNFRQAQEIARLGSWIYEFSDQVSWSDETYRIYGVSRETFNLNVESFISLIHPEDRPAMQAWIKGCAAGEKPGELEFRAIWPDGAIRYISGRGELIQEPEGQLAHMAGTAMDITERKLAEEKTRQAMREMTVLNSLARQLAADISQDRILDASLAGITEIIHPDMVFIFIRNGEELELLRSGPGGSPLQHDIMPLHHVGDCLCGLAASSGEPVYSANILTDPLCTRDECKKAGVRSFAALPLLVENQVLGVIGMASKTGVDFERQGSFLEAYSGEIALGLKNALLVKEVMNHAVELEKEVTERKKAEEELRGYRDQLEVLVEERTRELEEAKQALMNIVEDLNLKTEELAVVNERLKEVDRLKSLFIASMSHELRTPLNSVIGFSSILLNEWIGPVNDEQKQSLTSIQRSGKHLLSLVNDVIDVSKIEAGMIEVDRGDFDLAELLEELEQTFAREVQDRQLVLTVQKLHLVMSTDRRRLLQCLLNLVSNAVKFTEQGGVKVAVSHDAEHGEVTFSVTDTGIGIRIEDQAQLFEAFSRIRSHISSKVLGTGLGLYLSKKIIIEILHGTISVISETGSGSTFTMIIPCRVEGESKYRSQPHENSAGSGRQQG